MSGSAAWNLVRYVFTLGACLGAWLLFTWDLSGRNLAVGALCAAAVAALSYDYFFERHEAERRSLLPRLENALGLVVVLLASIYRASFRVALAAATGRISPRIVFFRTRLRSDLGRAALANAITLTPGTITLELDGDHLVVHWLNATTGHSKAAGEAVKGRLERWIGRVFS